MITTEGRIIIIDDNPDICTTLCDILEDAGYEVKDFEKGRKALDFIRKNPFDVVFIDIKLPDIDGIGLLEQIRLINPESAAIMITGHASTATAVEALNEGAYAYVVKPFDLDELKTIVKKAIKEIRLSLENKNLIDQLQKTNRELERYKKSLEERTIELEDAVVEAERMTQQAAEATEAKSKFLANMSHEIRTPMNAIIGFSDLLSEEQLTKEQTQYVHLIMNSGNHLLNIINDILDFSKIEAGKLTIEVMDCSLAELLESIRSIMKPKAEEKGLEFELINLSKLPSQIRTDPGRVGQCLMNLTSNALKFTENGHVHVNVSLEDKENQSYIRFDIEDTGVGIPPKIQKTIFESFTQADGTTSRKYGGTGLGLAITKQLAELLGGEVGLISEEDKGSTFSLVIPAGLDVTKQPSLDWDNIIGHRAIPKEETNKSGFSGHVLVAEDVKTNQTLIKLLFEQMGLEVTIAKDGSEVVQKALSRQFDLMFMDIQMPGMNGCEATKILRREGIKTPIVALTANALRGDDKKCIEAGCDDYLAKPIDRGKLLKTIGKYLFSKSEASFKKVDLTKSKVNELVNLCSDQVSQGHSSEETPCIEANEEVINWDQLISRLEDEEVIKDVVPMFLNDSDKRLGKLSEAVKSQDGKEIKLYAHAIRGAAGNVGAKRLSEIASQMECASRENDIETVTSLFVMLKTELEKVITFLSRPDWIEIVKQKGGRNKHVTSPITSKSLSAFDII